ncbi:MAG TPA: hypothetical protein VNS58_09175 [Puia sp.]|nr:hypothetical protein [Puia sp.]
MPPLPLATIPSQPPDTQRSELITWYTHYESVVKDELEFFFKYMNFYSGLLSALLAGTLAGILTYKPPATIGLILLIGPRLIGFLSYIGYQNVKVYYRRYVIAWITVINLRNILGLAKRELISTLAPPIFPHRREGGFLAEYNRPPIQALFDWLKKDQADDETVLNALLEHGNTLKFAQYLFWVFAVAAGLLAIVITLSSCKILL